MNRPALPYPVLTGLLAGLLLGGVGSVAGLRWLGGTTGLDDDDAPAEKADRARPGAGVVVTAAQRAAAGLRLAPLSPASTGTRVVGYARALDLAPLAALAAEATTAEAALAASSREEARLAGLLRDDAGASRRELETIRAQRAADQARLTIACQRVGLDYGSGLARLGCSRLAALAQAAAAGQLAILRIDLPGTPLAAGTTVDVALTPDRAPVRVVLLGPAAAGDSSLQTVGMLAMLHGPAASRAGVGRVLPAAIDAGGGRAGVLNPRAAHVRSHGGLFAWRPSGPDRFERLPLDGAQPSPDGWIVPVGTWQPGQPVVVAGAGTLLGLERAAPAPADD